MLRPRWLGLALLGLAPVALAQTSNAVRLEYHAPASCPDSAVFTALVHARSPRIRVENDAGRVLDVRITQSGGKITGKFTLHEPDGSARDRSVTGTSCDDVVSGLALIAAVAIDPDAGTPAPSVSSSSPHEPAPKPTETAAPPGPPPPAWVFSLFADAELGFGASPTVLFGVPISLEVALATRSLFAPAVRLRFERTISGTRTNDQGADFIFTLGDLDLCPVAWSPWRLRVQGCGRTEIGVLEAQGAGVAPVRSSVRPYLAFGPVADVRLAIYGPLFLDLQGGLEFLAIRDRYFLEPATTVFDMPVVVGRAGLGAGAILW